MPEIQIDPRIIRAAKIERYRRSFATFTAEQLKVKPKIPGPVQAFVLNPPQQKTDAIIEKQLRETGKIRVVCLKARQPGLSTYSSARGFWKASLHENIVNLVIAQDKETSRHIFDLTRLFYDQMHEDVRPIIRYGNRNELDFANPDDRTRQDYPGLRSKISFNTANNIHSGTGQTVHFLHLSESSKVPEAETVWQSLLPAVPNAPGTSIIIESTAFPTGDWFHEMCLAAQAGDNGFEFVFLPWFLSPEYSVALNRGERLHMDGEEKYLVKTYSLTPQQLKFRRQQIQMWGGDGAAEDRFNIEYPHSPEVAFTSTELNCFDRRKLYEISLHYIREPKMRCEIFPGPTGLQRPLVKDVGDGEFWVWEEPQKGEDYDIGIDVAVGVKEGDWSVIEVIKRRNREQVAEYRLHIDPLDLAEKAALVGYWYNTAQIACEVNGVGFATNDALNKSGYLRSYIWRQFGKAAPVLSSYSGWKTQPDSKKLMVSTLRHMLLHDKLIFHSKILLQEMRAYAVYYLPAGGEEYSGSAGVHDDSVVAFGIAQVVSEQDSFGTFDASPVRLADKSSFIDPALCDTTPLGQQINRMNDPIVRMMDSMKDR